MKKLTLTVAGEKPITMCLEDFDDRAVNRIVNAVHEACTATDGASKPPAPAPRPTPKYSTMDSFLAALKSPTHSTGEYVHCQRLAQVQADGAAFRGDIFEDRDWRLRGYLDSAESCGVAREVALRLAGQDSVSRAATAKILAERP